MQLGLTFDDVCLVPQFNNVISRSTPDVTSWITRNRQALPIVPANMDTVICPKLSDVLDEYDGDVIDHRFHHGDLDILKKRVLSFDRSICISWGLHDWEGLDLMLQWGHDNGHIWGVCFDVAHGHCNGMFEMIDRVRQKYTSNIEIIAGNVCTSLGYQELVSYGASAVKVGVGCGAACTTRMITGFGVPQFTAIQDCATLAKKLRVPIIADGGIRNSRDIVLALAAGANSVMMGKLFAACDESAADKELRDPEYFLLHSDESTEVVNPVLKAKYRGQASFDFQREFYGEVKHAPEGEAMWIPVSGSASDLLENLIKQIKAGMTYAGATSIKELQQKAEFMHVTETYAAESNVRE